MDSNLQIQSYKIQAQAKSKLHPGAASTMENCIVTR